ncbi:hypothetical protein ACT1U9_04770 [Streptomyces sp. BR1]|uniref:hypothetical protein n=1 Tax=Streptomyces sp. BR1 TaxID=1592323 RepID=UPI00402BC4B7
MTTPARQPLDAASRSRLQAVVFDTNAFGHGLPDLRQLRLTAAQMGEAGLETWVPEPVAWEWAEHLAKEVEAYRSAAGSVIKRMERGGITAEVPVLPTADPAETTGLFLKELGDIPHLTVLPLSGDAARAGLRDQIMQTGPGRRKQGIKTGASDSAWLREVLTAAGGSFAGILLLTQDRADIHAACQGLGIAPPTMLTVRDLAQSVLGFVADPGHISKLITTYFANVIVELHELSREGVPAHPEFDLGTIEVDPVLLDGYRWPQMQIHDVSVRHLDRVVAVSDVRVDTTIAAQSSSAAGKQVTSGTAEATVEALADLEVWTYEIDRDGEVQMDSHMLYDTRVIAPVLVQIKNGLVLNVSPLGDTRAGRSNDETGRNSS